MDKNDYDKIIRMFCSSHDITIKEVSQLTGFRYNTCKNVIWKFKN